MRLHSDFVRRRHRRLRDDEWSSLEATTLADRTVRAQGRVCLSGFGLFLLLHSADADEQTR